MTHEWRPCTFTVFATGVSEWPLLRACSFGVFCVKIRLLFSMSRSQWGFKTLLNLSPVPLISWQPSNHSRCADLLLIITKPSTRKWAQSDSSTLTYSITRHTTGVGLVCGWEGGVYFAMQGDNKPWWVFCVCLCMCVCVHVRVCVCVCVCMCVFCLIRKDIHHALWTFLCINAHNPQLWHITHMLCFVPVISQL